MTRGRMLAIFFLIAIGGSAAIAFGFPSVWATPSARVLALLHMAPVLLATLLVQGPVLKQRIAKPLGLQVRVNRWWLFGIVGPVLLLALSLLAAWLLFGVDPVLDAQTFVANKRSLVPEADLAAFDQHLRENVPPHPLWLVVQAVPAGVTVNLLVALMTELGWRGLLFREIPGGFWARSLGIGLFEAAWMVPVVALGLHFAEHPSTGALTAAAWCLVASPVLVYLRVRGDSVLPVAAFRGVMLALALAATDLAWGAEDWQRPFYGVSGVVGMGALLLGCMLHDRFVAAEGLIFPRAPRSAQPDSEADSEPDSEQDPRAEEE